MIRRFGNGKGKGKNKGRTYLANLTDDDVQSTFAYFGKGKSKGRGKNRTSGMGLGRKGNPIGPDGNQLKCHECESTEHLVKDCPRRQHTGRQMFVGTYAPATTPTSSSWTPLTSLAASGPPEPDDQAPLLGCHRVYTALGSPLAATLPGAPRMEPLGEIRMTPCRVEAPGSEDGRPRGVRPRLRDDL